ncbi:MAG: hypothetical protein IKE92_04365 [Clostridiales bacterium]|nr:hypothetical protein [Clostridiales bacterium]
MILFRLLSSLNNTMINGTKIIDPKKIMTAYLITVIHFSVSRNAASMTVPDGR